MSQPLKLFDVVALTESISGTKLVRGQVGTIVEVYSADAFEVEFCDDDGRTYAMLPLRADQLMILHHRRLQLA